MHCRLVQEGAVLRLSIDRFQAVFVHCSDPSKWQSQRAVFALRLRPAPREFASSRWTYTRMKPWWSNLPTNLSTGAPPETGGTRAPQCVADKRTGGSSCCRAGIALASHSRCSFLNVTSILPLRGCKDPVDFFHAWSFGNRALRAPPMRKCAAVHLRLPLFCMSAAVEDAG